ncbi:hypothetical protein JHV56_05175 [Arthrobacter sp. BHU FT2]|nr:hypothetical protein [Arthrobacter sp. BHU FT2]
MTAFTGAAAMSAGSAQAAPGDKTSPNTYVPLAEKGAPSGVAALDASAKIQPAQLPDLSGVYVSKTPRARNASTGWVHVADFGALGDGASDDTGAIQAAIDLVASTRNRGALLFPPGDFRVSRLIWRKGVYGRGAGIAGFGTPNTQQGTRIRQLDNQNTDVICYDEPASSNGRTYAGPAGLVDMEVVGNATSTVGYCLNFTTPDGRPCSIQDTLTLQNLLLRGGAQGGVQFPAGGFPLHVTHVNCLWNGGPGIKYLRSSTGASQAIHFDNISGDGNVGGLIFIDNENNATAGEFLITNLKSEARINAAFGNQAAQMNAVVLNRCPAPVTILNANHYSSIDSGPYAGVVPGPLVLATNTTPNVHWAGLILDTNGRSGNPFLLDDQSQSQKVPYTPALGRRGSYGLNPSEYNAAATNETGLWTYGQLGAVKPDVLSHGIEVAGITPGYAFYETDAADFNEKVWSIIASGGNLSFRTHADSGAAGAIIVEFQRNGTTVGAMRVAAPITPYTSSTTARRSAAQAGAGSMAFDTTLGKPIWSDGTIWRDANGALA